MQCLLKIQKFLNQPVVFLSVALLDLLLNFLC